MADAARDPLPVPGDVVAQVDGLLPLVYGELRKLAAAKLQQEAAGQTLQPTALVHGVYLRLAEQKSPQQWAGRRHFLAAAAEAMRRILIDRARQRQALRHGGQRQRVSWDGIDVATDVRHADDLIDLDAAIAQLAADSPARAELVKLRFYTGLSMPKIADLLGVSLATAERQWLLDRQPHGQDAPDPILRVVADRARHDGPANAQCGPQSGARLPESGR